MTRRTPFFLLISLLITVAASSQVVKVYVRGSVVYNNPQWNAWSVTAGTATQALKDSTGATTTIRATLQRHTNVSDNGATWPVTFIPREVGRYASYHTTVRSLTITGLDVAKVYDLELYATRDKPGQSTKFSMGTDTVLIMTHENLTKAARFLGRRPATNGSLVVSIVQGPGSEFNYLNGFRLVGYIPNRPPVVNAGPDTTIVINHPSKEVYVRGTAFDPDGDSMFVQWSAVPANEGPAVRYPDSLRTPLSGYYPNTWMTFKLLVIDKRGAVGTDEVQVRVRVEEPAVFTTIRWGALTLIVYADKSVCVLVGREGSCFYCFDAGQELLGF